MSVNSRGDVHRTVSVPGTGLYKRERIVKGNNKNAHEAQQESPAIITEEQLADMPSNKRKFYKIVSYFGITISIMAVLLFWLCDIKLLSAFFCLFIVWFAFGIKRYK